MRGREMSYLRHDGNGCLSGGFGYFVLNEEEHVFIVEKSDEMEGAKAGSTAQGKVTNHHRAGEINREESKIIMQQYKRMRE
jgi:predicted RNA-binding protein (virulence factor B family)